MNKRPRRGAAHSLLTFVLGTVIALVACVAFLAWDPQAWLAPASRPQPLVVYCAAGLRVPVEEVAKAYEAAYGVPVQLHYGGSQTLLATLTVARRGDVYIPADDSYLKAASDKHLIAETHPLACMAPVVAVPKGNPKGVRTLADLLKPGVRLAQGNPDAAAIGSVTRAVLEKAGQWDALKDRTVVFKLTVNDVANDVQVGAVDAGIVWDATVRQTPGLEAVPLAEFANTTAHVAAATLTDSLQPSAALRFVRYLAARDRGQTAFAKHGYAPADGPVWAEDATPGGPHHQAGAK